MKEIRKLQVSAGGTYIVTVPKQWIEEIGLAKGNPVIMSMENGEIIISPAERKPPQESRSINAGTFEHRKLLELALTASYIQGYDVTQIFSENPENHVWKEWARSALEGLVGVEVLEDYSDRMLLQNLVDPFKFDFMRMLEKFSRNASAVLADAVQAIVTGDGDLASDAFYRGSELTKSYRLLMRLAMLSARDKEVRRQFGIESISGVIVNVIATREMGRIAYYAMRTSEHVLEFHERLPERISELLVSMEKQAREMQRKAFLALLERNIRLASQVIDSMGSVRDIYNEMHESAEYSAIKGKLPLAIIIRDIRAIAGYAVALADDSVLGVFS